jgi:hypothetical protein
MFSLRWSEGESFAGPAFYKHLAPLGRRATIAEPRAVATGCYRRR